MQLVAEAGLVPTSGSTLPRFTLLRPRTVGDAAAMLRSAAAPLLLAGGTDLVAAFNEGTTAAELVDLTGIDELRTIVADHSEGVSIGATVTHHAGSGHDVLRARFASFARAWSRIANPRVRFVATLGGNLMARRVRYEGAVMLAALNARLAFVAPGEGSFDATPERVWQHLPARALLRSIHLDATGLVWFDYERSLRPLMTLAIAVRRRRDGGLSLHCAVATEYVAPVVLHARLPSAAVLAQAAGSRAAAVDAFASLPAGFTAGDPVATSAYVRTAGAALLARQLERHARQGAGHV